MSRDDSNLRDDDVGTSFDDHDTGYTSDENRDMEEET